jgi:hypothetical protein
MKTLINENSKSSSNKLSHPQGIEDMFLYRINRLRAKGGGVVLRYCEGEFVGCCRFHLLRCQMKREVANGDEKKIQPGVQA